MIRQKRHTHNVDILGRRKLVEEKTHPKQYSFIKVVTFFDDECEAMQRGGGAMKEGRNGSDRIAQAFRRPHWTAHSVVDGPQRLVYSQHRKSTNYIYITMERVRGWNTFRMLILAYNPFRNDNGCHRLLRLGRCRDGRPLESSGISYSISVLHKTTLSMLIMVTNGIWHFR